MQSVNPTAAGSTGKIHALTSLRFFAAFNVVVGHTVLLLTNWTWEPFFRYMWTGFSIAVSFFFLLSGYILAVVYLKGRDSLDTRKFLIARVARIYPLYLLTLILDAPNLIATRVHLYGWHVAIVGTTATFAANVLTLQAWYMKLRGLNFPNWSLSVEALFYLTFPFVGLFLWRLRGARIWLSMLGIYASGQLLVWLIAPHFLTRPLYQKIDERNPLFHLATFALGILLARWQVSHEQQTPKERTNSLFLYGVLALATVALLAAPLFKLQLPAANITTGLYAPVFCAFIWVFSHSETLVARLLCAKWLVLLGEASFGLYLIHIPIFHLLEYLHPHPSVFLFPLYLLFCVGASVLCFVYFESPSRKWILARARSRSRESEEAASIAQ